jgi:hypothetical protein
LKRKDVDTTFSQCPSPSTAPEQSGINREKTKFHERVPHTPTLNHKWLEVLFLFFPAAQSNRNQDLYKILQIERRWWVIYISVRAHANIYINQILYSF